MRNPRDRRWVVRTKLQSLRRMRIEELETRLALHADEPPPTDDGGSEHIDDWIDHVLYDGAALDGTAANPPDPGLAEALVDPNAPLSEVGQWSPLQNWPIEFINALMLPTGKVLGYDRTLNLRLWDPVTNTFTSPAEAPYNIFCTGTALLADGTVLVTGGHVVDTVGLPYAAIYDPFADSWTQLSNMNAGRWYPSSTTLANGDVLVLSGDTNATGATNPLPQIYEAATGTWRDLTSAEQYLSFYPRTFSAPNGAAFIAGPDPLSQYLDVTGTGEWIPVAYRIHPYRGFGSAVMYAPGKVLYIGGGSPASNTAEVIDLNDADPEWRQVGDIEFARRNANATLLPNGEALIVGGNSGSGNYDGDAVLAAEIWNPVTETFRTVANMDDIRWYHSTAVLLPDGRVLSTSGDLHLTGQTYSPPYLFQGPRPTISSAPQTVQYGDTFFVGTPDAAQISKVRWVRLGTATHAQDWDQYIQEAVFTTTAGGLNVTAPPTPNTAPPGYYMLFILDGEVPSVASIIKVGTTLPEVTVDDSSLVEGANGITRDLVFTVSLDLSSADAVTVAYSTIDGTALAGDDYIAQAGTLTFAPLQTLQTITVPIIGDGVAEDTEAFTVNLAAPVGGVLIDAEAEGAIRNFGSLPVIEIEGGKTVEADSGTTDATFVVTLSEAAAASEVTVVYSTVDGTATAGQSYIAQSGTLTFAPGITQMNIVVPVIGDTIDEINNTFMIQLSDPAGAELADPQAQMSIYNNDDPPTASFGGSETIDEPVSGTATVTLTVALSSPSAKDVVVHWTTGANGTAVPGVNFIEKLGRIVFAPGETVKTFTVDVLGDGIKTTDRTFSVQMQSELLSANYGNRYIPVTIVDTDSLPAISLDNAFSLEGSWGATALVFAASLTAPVAGEVTVAFATSAGTATANVDYEETFGTITFTPGVTQQLITVMAGGDTAAESNETFNLVLSNPTGALLGAGQAVGTIVDDDGAPVPAAPVDLDAVAGYGMAALKWDAVAGATSYRVFRGIARGGAGTTPIALGITEPTFTDTGLANGTWYYYWVTAVHSPGPGVEFEGSASEEVKIIPTSYDFTAGFPGRSLDPTVLNAEGSRDVLSMNGMNIENVRLFGATLQLTDGGTNQTDSVFTRLPVNVTRFNTNFAFEQIPSLGYVDPLADGMTFTIQGVGPAALGGSGGALGYTSIGASVAVKFDLYDNAGEGANSTGLFINGVEPNAAGSINLDGTGIDLHSGHVFTVGMTYDGTTLAVTITDTLTLATATQSYAVDIPAIVGGNLAYVGFTAGTGGLTAVQSIYSWIFTPAPAAPADLEVASVSGTQVSLIWTNDPNAAGVLIERKTGVGGTYLEVGTTGSPTANTFSDTTVDPGATYYYRVRATGVGGPSAYSNEIEVTTPVDSVPEINFPDGFEAAGGAFSFNGPTAGIVGATLQLTDGGTNQADSVFTRLPVNVTRFNTNFAFEQIPSLGYVDPLADGMTFTIQGVGPAALGGSGGALGYTSIGASVAVKFDLYDNAGEGANSTGLFINGVEPNAAGSINLDGTGIDLHSGHVFTVGMTYDGTTLAVTITDTLTLATATQSYAVDIPAIVGGNLAYVGFTAGTGGLTAVQNVLSWTFDSQSVEPTNSTVAGRFIFYNQSTFDGNSAAINASDNNAIAPDKTPLLANAGQAVLANITSFTRGINGIMIDLSANAAHSGITANDFIFKVGNNNTPSGWAVAPAPSALSVSMGGGLSGSDRVTITWAANVIQNTYLEVGIRANANTNLSAGPFTVDPDGPGVGTAVAVGDVFFFGNLIGETASVTPAGAFARTVAADGGAILAAGTQLNVGITNTLDVNKSNSITATADRGPIISAGAGTLTRILIGTVGPYAPDDGGDAGIASTLASTASPTVQATGTGGLTAVQNVLSWTFDSQSVEPTAAPIFVRATSDSSAEADSNGTNSNPPISAVTLAPAERRSLELDLRDQLLPQVSQETAHVTHVSRRLMDPNIAVSRRDRTYAVAHGESVHDLDFDLNDDLIAALAARWRGKR